MNTQNTIAQNDSLAPETVERIIKNVSKSGLEVTRVYTSDWQKEGTLTAEIKQTVKTTTSYPSKSVSNNMQDNIFGNNDFGFETKNFENEEVRVAWIDVPLGSTVESVVAKLNQFPKATLYKVLSNKPILNDSQIYAIANDLTTKDIIGDRQVVRYPKNHEDAGSLVLDNNGKIQYRVVCFKTTTVEDVDARTSAMEDVYMTPTIAAEFNDAIQQKVIE